MRELERTMTYYADAEKVFSYVSNPANFPQYLPTLRKATKEDGEKIRIEGSSHGHDYNVEGHLKIDREAHRMEWGARDGHYHGWLTVKGGDATNTLSEVTVHLSFGDSAVTRHKTPEQFDEAMLEAMLKTLQHINEHVGNPAPAAY